MKIYGRLNSSNVQKVLWTLAELELPFTRVDAGREFGFPEQYEAMNFNKLVPVMDDAGFVLWESNAIVRYLARKHGSGSLAPADLQAYADADRWMDWGSQTFYGAFGSGFVNVYRMPIEKRDPALLLDSFNKTSKVVAQMNQVLADRQYFCGSQFTMADIVLGMAAQRWFNMPYAQLIDAVLIPELPHLRAYYERMQKRPGFVRYVDEPLS
ncbi:MAG: glutathione S-transferase [Pseudomonadota bacterium]|jgi:glutathione S-transferase